MCGRLVLTADYKERIRAIFDDLEAGEWLPARYNITPGQRLPVVHQAAPRRMQWMNWGVTPATTRSDRRGSLLINARGETIHRLPTFKDAFLASRCIIFADGFYEWKRSGSGKPQPYFFGMRDRSAFALAGLVINSNGPQTSGCVVVTTEANSLMHRVHDRMPVIFTRQSATSWLDAETGVETLKTMLQPYPSSEMACHPVSDRVNRATSEGPDLIERASVIEQTELF